MMIINSSTTTVEAEKVFERCKIKLLLVSEKDNPEEYSRLYNYLISHSEWYREVINSKMAFWVNGIDISMLLEYNTGNIYRISRCSSYVTKNNISTTE